MKKTPKKGGMGKAVAVGAGVAAAGAAAYMLLGPNGKKNRAKVASVAKKVMDKAKKNKEVMAMASAAIAGLKAAKSKAKGAMKTAKSAAKKAVKKGMGAAKKAAKAGVKKVAKKTAR